jgi:serine/threonine protein kinase
MALTIGTQLGSHEITALLGKGGMGEVYRARDTKLKREVAIKVLPEAFSRDPERLLRFQREAEVLASLNHANIASIYDLQESKDTRYLVLELVEGETLADRIQRGAIPVDEALLIAKRICEAVEWAHEKGVIHRDLKPANIKLTPDGQIKVLDFGLAKVFSDSGNTELANSPTLMSASIPGAILGTAAYMSPEQAKGKAADRGSDVWSFGCVFYEMLTGRAVFAGETVGEILAEVFKAEPAWDRLPAETPTAIRRLLRRCLQKDRTRRLRSLDAARIEIEDALAAPEVADEIRGAGTSNVPVSGKRILGYVLVSLAMLTAGLLLGRFWQPRLQPAPVVRFTLPLPDGQKSDFDNFGVLSADGQYFVRVASGSEGSQMWLQKLDSSVPKLLPGTTGASRPFWSPDNQSIGFFADGKLKRTDINGTLPRNLADAPDTRGGSWNAAGIIIFSASAGTPISKIPEIGGTPVDVTVLSKSSQDAAHRWPTFLPDGKHFTYVVSAGQPESAGVFIGSIDDPSVRIRILPMQSQSTYVKSGHLLYVSESVLYARPFDLKTLSFTGEPAVIEQNVYAHKGTGWAGYTASQTGVVAVELGSSLAFLQRQLVWYDRSSKKLEPIAEPGAYATIALSPDAKSVALEKRDPETSATDLWLMDLGRGVTTRLTSNPLWDQAPVWSPDGNDIVFFSNRTGTGDLYRKHLAGSADEMPFFKSDTRKWPTGWSADGKYVMFESRDQNQWDLLAATGSGSLQPIRFLTSRFNERQGRFSPDGSWVAYASDESGQYEIYVQSFPNAGSKIQVSTKGGVDPQWRRDGTELFFIQEGKIHAVSVSVAGGRIVVGEPHSVTDTVSFSQLRFNPNMSAQFGVTGNG